MATAVVQRPYRGLRVSSFYPVKSIPPLSSLDSAFQLQEYISLLIRLDVHDVDAIVSLPGKASQKDPDENVSDVSQNETKPTEDAERKNETSTVDRACWIYEQLRCVRSPALRLAVEPVLQSPCTGSFPPPYYLAATGMYSEILSANEGGRMALFMRCSRERWCPGGLSFIHLGKLEVLTTLL